MVNILAARSENTQAVITIAENSIVWDKWDGITRDRYPQADRQTDKQAGGQTGRQADKHVHR